MRPLAILPLAAVLSVPMVSPVVAHIICDHEYQVVEGGETPTPYCQDDNLARVAREHGRHVSAGEVRNNSALRNELCKTFGDDIEVRNTCAQNQDR